MLLLLSLLPLFALLAVAAGIDARTRRLPNWLTGLIVLTGFTNAIASGVPTPLTDALLGFLVGFSILLIPFALGAMGGGDVKLLAGVGAWLGTMATIQVYLVAAIAGLIIVMTQAILTGRLTRLVRNSTLIVANLANFDQVGREQFAATGQSLRSVDKPLPYAVPTLIGVIVVVAMQLK